MSITRNFNLFLNAGKSIPLVINVNQYDQGETWVFTLYNDDGTQYTPSSGSIVGIKADGYAITNAWTVNGSGQVVITETQQMTAAAGKATFELQIDGLTHGTANFVVMVEPSPTENAVVSDSDLSLIQEAVDAAAQIQPYGTPLVANTAAAMTDHDKVYVYGGSEQGYINGHWYYWDGDSWEDGGVYNSQGIGARTVNGLKLTDDLKTALLNYLDACTLETDDGDALYDALVNALFPPADLLSISCAYTQSGSVYNTDDINVLKNNLVVTAYYTDLTSRVIDGSEYTLTGTLTVGTSTIIATYGGMTDDFTVTVSDEDVLPTGYTKYDYITCTKSTTVSSGGMMVLATYEDLNNVSVKFNVCQYDTTVSSAQLFGARSQSGASKSLAFYAYNQGTNLGYMIHGVEIMNVPQLYNDRNNVVIYTNTSASPSYLKVNDNAQITCEWSNDNTLNLAPVLFLNPVNLGSSTPTKGTRIGKMYFYDLSGTLLNRYIPALRTADNVVGMYDNVGDRFYTTSTASYSTVGNSSQMYAVGNWE